MPGGRSADISATAATFRSAIPGERAIVRAGWSGRDPYQIVRQGGAQVVNLTGVRRRGEPLVQTGEQQHNRRRGAERVAAGTRYGRDNRVLVPAGVWIRWADLKGAHDRDADMTARRHGAGTLAALAGD